MRQGEPPRRFVEPAKSICGLAVLYAFGMDYADRVYAVRVGNAPLWCVMGGLTDLTLCTLCEVQMFMRYTSSACERSMTLCESLASGCCAAPVDNRVDCPSMVRSAAASMRSRVMVPDTSMCDRDAQR